MKSRTVKVIQFWVVLCWGALTVYLAYQKWPESYGPEFGDFLIRTALFGLTPFALAALFVVGKRNISLSLSQRAAEAEAGRVAAEAIRKAKS